MLLNTVFQRLVFNSTKKYQWQVKHEDNPGCSYLPPWCPVHYKHVVCEHMRFLDVEDLRLHFSQKLWKQYENGKLSYSGLSLGGLFPGGRTRWLILDMDTPLACHTVRTLLVPTLNTFGIEWLWEHSGTPDYEKAHLLIFMDCTLLLQKTFVPMLLSAANMDDWQQWNLLYPEEFKLEMFPFQFEENKIRLPGSIHQRTGQVNFCTSKNKTSNSKEDILKMLASMKVLTADRITQLVMSLNPEYEKKLQVKEQIKLASKSINKFDAPVDFKYIPINLELPVIPVVYPKTFKKMASSCQAMNTLWNRSVYEGALQKGNIHKWGLYLANLALFDDLQQENKFKSSDYSIGEKFLDFTYDYLRGFGYEKHNWKKYKEKFKEIPLVLVPGCEKMSANFGLCGGCVYAGQPNFISPSQFVTGTAITRTVTGQSRIITNEEIRSVEFPQIKNWIKQKIFHKKTWGLSNREDIVLSHQQGSGKSICADELMAELSYYGATSLLAVPDARLALQHKSMFDYYKQKSMTIFSFKKLFSEEVMDAMGTANMCPHYDAIKSVLDVFPLSAYVKENYCEACPFKTRCPYPRQYADIAKSDANIVIIQHAHLLTRPARQKILKKRYDLTVIDENFLDKCFIDYKASPGDLKVLEFLCKDYPWLKAILDWLNQGGFPSKNIGIDVPDLQRINLILASLKIENFLPELVQHFLSGAYYNPLYGIQKFVPLPGSYTGLRLFTDATIPLDYFKVCVNNSKPFVFGEDSVLNVKNYHPESEYRQSLDSSTSVTQMSKPGYLEMLARYACRKMEKSAPHEKALFTTYASQEEQARDFIRAEYPHLSSRITVSHMEIGTNAYADYTYQFLAASCYPDAVTLAKEAWKISIAWNHWLESENQCLGRTDKAELPFYETTSPGGSYPTRPVQLERKEIIGRQCYKTQYHNLFYRQPTIPTYQLGAEMFRSVKSQSTRLRPRKGFKTVITDFDKIETNWAVTESFAIGQITAELL